MYLPDENKIWICQNKDGGIYMTPKMANRHGLVAGATGTGKTVTLKVLAESFSEMGVPVFLADIKGDVSGMCLPGEDSAGFQKRIKTKLGLDIEWKFQGYPLRFWDVYGKGGIPVRTTVSDMGPELLARLLELTDAQAGVLNIVFKFADAQGLLLLDLKDLRMMLTYTDQKRDELKTTYGNVTSQSIGAIQRSLLKLEDQGGDIFFGEPALDLWDWFATGEGGRGVINLLHCPELVQHPLLYSTFLLWMLSELYEMLPEAGDLDKPKMIFFFDEAHLIFKNTSPVLLDKVEQIVRLIRSKGIGIYFITQSPADIPDPVLAQLGNKLQHALRAYTPKERKGVKAAAQAFRANPNLKTEEAIGELGTGEVLVSLLDEDGVPSMVQRAFVMPPRSYLGVASDEVRNKIMQEGHLYAKYGRSIDRVSAYEVLTGEADRSDDRFANEAYASDAGYGDRRSSREARGYGDERSSRETRGYRDESEARQARGYGDERSSKEARDYGDERSSRTGRSYGDERRPRPGRDYGDERGPRPNRSYEGERGPRPGRGYEDERGPRPGRSYEDEREPRQTRGYEDGRGSSSGRTGSANYRSSDDESLRDEVRRNAPGEQTNSARSGYDDSYDAGDRSRQAQSRDGYDDWYDDDYEERPHPARRSSSSSRQGSERASGSTSANSRTATGRRTTESAPRTATGRRTSESAPRTTTSRRTSESAPRTTSSQTRTTATTRTTSTRQTKSTMDKAVDSALSTFGRTVASTLARGLLGNLLKKSK